jgi:hypothetical protein
MLKLLFAHTLIRMKVISDIRSWVTQAVEELYRK